LKSGEDPGNKVAELTSRSYKLTLIPPIIWMFYSLIKYSKTADVAA